MIENEMEIISLKQIIDQLEQFWNLKGCKILIPYDIEMGAATFHPTIIKSTIFNQDAKIAFVQPCRRPQDNRAGENPNRLYKFHQFQVLINPAPHNIQELFMDSLIFCGVNPNIHDIDFREDNWGSPSIGATGKGYEIRCNGMEICQFTYFQQISGNSLNKVPIELAYGLERLAYIIQNKDHIFDVVWDTIDGKEITYGEIHKEFEKEYSVSNYSFHQLNELFNIYESMKSTTFIKSYETFLHLCNIFNLIDGLGVFSHSERISMMARVRFFANKIIRKELS